MRVMLLAPGSRGDVQPYVALGVGFLRAGHSVELVTTLDHATLAAEYGLSVSTVSINVQAALQARAVAASVEGGGLVASFRQFARLAADAARETCELGLAAARRADVVVSGFSGAFVAEGIARRAGVPLVQAFNVPLTPTSAFPGALFPRLPFHRLGHRLTRLAVWTVARMSSDAARRQVLGMPRAPWWPPGRNAGLVEGPVVYGISPAVLPRDPAWTQAVTTTGFWFADAPDGFVPPEALAQFLERGPAPVCIGFGSMALQDPAATTARVLEAVRRARVRAVLLSGWSGLTPEALGSDVCAVGGVPHAWLYPRCRAVVHHGGAGTTAAALRAGVPAIIVPFHGDQPFWARHVHALGTAPRPIPRTRLTASALAAAIERAGDRAMVRAAAALGERVRAENGVADAVAAIARHAGTLRN